MRHGGCHCLPPSPAGQPASTMSPQLLHIIIFCAQRTHILPIYSWFCFIHLNCSFSCGSNANAPNICDSFFFFFSVSCNVPIRLVSVAHVACIGRRLSSLRSCVFHFFTLFFRFHYISCFVRAFYVLSVSSVRNVHSLLSFSSSVLYGVIDCGQQIHRVAKIYSQECIQTDAKSKTKQNKTNDKREKKVVCDITLMARRPRDHDRQLQPTTGRCAPNKNHCRGKYKQTTLN